jgi:hypothetical protein
LLVLIILLDCSRLWQSYAGILKSTIVVFGGECVENQLKGRPFSSDMEVIATAVTWLDGHHSEFF